MSMLWLAFAGAIFSAQPGCERRTGATTRSMQMVRAEHRAGQPLVVDATGGSIEIERAPDPMVTVEATIESSSADRAERAEVQLQRGSEGSLRVWLQWPEGEALPGESVAFKIAIPDASTITATTTMGSIQLRGLAGRAELSTQNGSITVGDFDGPVDASTANGAITLTDVGPARARARNGAISMTLRSDTTGPVFAITDNGPITLLVGPAFAGEVVAVVDNGAIACGVERAKELEATATRARYDFGPPTGTNSPPQDQPPPSSTLETGNGIIRIESR